MRKVPEFAPFLAKLLGGMRHFSKANFTSVFTMCPLRGGRLPRKAFQCVCGWKRYLFMAIPRGRVSINTNIDGATGGISGKCGSAESAGICSIYGEILRELRHFPKAKFTSVFIMSPLREGSFPGRNSRAFSAENGTYIWKVLEGACPSIPTSTGRKGDFWEIRKVPKVPALAPFR